MMHISDRASIESMSRDASGWTFIVEVGESDQDYTSHTVRLDDDYYQELTDGQVDPEVVIEQAFAYLLEREEKESIAPSFDLDIIGKYFPGFELDLKQLLEDFKE